MPFGSHWFDLLPLIVLALLVFGPKRLPEMGASIGKTIKEFQRSMCEVTNPGSSSDTSDATATTPQLTAPVAVPTIAAPTSMHPDTREATSTEILATETTKAEHAAMEAPLAS